MGYGAAAWRRRRQRRNLWLIAHAALAGAVIVKQRVPEPNDAIWHWRWNNHYPDGQVSHHYRSRGEASAVYLAWWLHKQGMLRGNMAWLWKQPPAGDLRRQLVER